jgi:hypothetical protein
MRHFLAGLGVGALALSCYSHRRAVVREWRWACRDLGDLRADLVRYCGSKVTSAA